MDDKQVYDMAVIGGGPGGYTAALYAARAGLSVVVLEKLSAGGQMALAHWIDNYPGFEEGIDGFTLAERMQKGAERFGVKTELAEVYSVELGRVPRVAKSSEGTIYARTVVFAAGAGPAELGLPMEKELAGRGVSYCAACDGMFYKDKTVAVVGGGDSAVSDVLALARIARKVIMVHRRDTLRAAKIYHESLRKTENVEFCWNSTVAGLLYEERLTGITIKDVNTGEERKVALDGIFISVGRKPASGLVQGQLKLDQRGYIIADESTCTDISGVFAVGDIRTKELRQVVTAVADGAMAAYHAEAYLLSENF